MNKKRRNKSYFGSRMILPLVILGIVIFTTVFAICTEKEKRVGDKALTNSIEFLRQRCIRYDNLVSSEETKDQMSLVDKTRELGRCLGTGEVDEDFLNDYATDQRLTSIILLDKDTKPISVVGSANQGYEAWCDIFKNENVIDVIKYPQKIYVSRMLQDGGNIYDYVVIARQRGEGLVFCCNKLIQSREDEMHIGIENLFSGYQFEMNGLVLIMDGEQILGSNNDEFIDTKIADYPDIQEHMSDISNNDVCKVQHDGIDYLARYSKCGSYYLAVLIPAKEIFRQRSVIMAYVFVLYVLFLLGFLLVRQNEMKNSNKRKMDFLRQMSHDIQIGRAHV